MSAGFRNFLAIRHIGMDVDASVVPRRIVRLGISLRTVASRDVEGCASKGAAIANSMCLLLLRVDHLFVKTARFAAEAIAGMNRSWRHRCALIFTSFAGEFASIAASPTRARSTIIASIRSGLSGLSRPQSATYAVNVHPLTSVGVSIFTSTMIIRVARGRRLVESVSAACCVRVATTSSDRLSLCLMSA